MSGVLRGLLVGLLILGALGCEGRRGGGGGDDDDSAADDDDSVPAGISWSPAVDADGFGLLDVGTVAVQDQATGQIIGTNGTDEPWLLTISPDLPSSDGWIYTLPTDGVEVAAGDSIEFSFTLLGVPGDVAERTGHVYFNWDDAVVSYEVTGTVQ